MPASAQIKELAGTVGALLSGPSHPDGSFVFLPRLSQEPGSPPGETL
jgi:hypothetical protein